MNELEKRITTIEESFDKFKIVGGENVNVSGGIKFGGYTVEVLRRVVSEATAEADVPGCTDPTACNFDESATVDDSSCTYGGACCVDTDCTITCEADCEGVYQGDDTVCDPNPCTPTGACCLPDDGGCSDETSDNCDGLGGIYEGDGTTCEGNVCGCSDPTACNYDPATTFEVSCRYGPSASLACDISFNSGSKCGFRVEGSPPHYYLTQEQDDTWTASSDLGGGQFCHGDADAHLNFTGSGSVVTTVTTSYDRDTCVLGDASECTGGGLLTLTRSVTGSNPTHCDDVLASCVSYSFSTGCPDGTWTFVGGGAHIDIGNPCGPFTVIGPSTSLVYSDEYTTADLISHVEDGLPPFPGTFEDGSCCSSRALSDDESTYSEQIAQYKFEFGGSSDDFQVDWVEQFTPAGGGGSTDTPRSDFFAAGTTESGIYSLVAPSTNGTTCIVDVVVTCL